MAIYIRNSDGTYSRLKEILKDINVQVLNNRVQVYELLASSGGTTPFTNDYIIADIFTDANGWQDTIDTNGTDAYYDSDSKSYQALEINTITDTPNTNYSSTYNSSQSTYEFYVYYTGSDTFWKITKIQLDTKYVDEFNIKIYRTDNNEQVFSGTFTGYHEGHKEYDVSGMPYVPNSTGLKVTLNAIYFYYDGSYDSTVNNVRVTGNHVPAHYYSSSFDIVEVQTLKCLDRYIKTNIFSLSSPIKQLLVFADRELINNPGEVEVKVYDTSDNLLASEEIMELIDISNYNVSDVYLKLKLKGSGNAYTKAYGYSVAFWV